MKNLFSNFSGTFQRIILFSLVLITFFSFATVQVYAEEHKISLDGTAYNPVTKKLKVVVKNTGNIDNPNLNVWYTYDPTTLAPKSRITIPGNTTLKPGESRSTEFNFNPDPRARGLVVDAEVSSWGGIFSGVARKRIDYPLPDLELTSLTYESGKPVKFVISNKGDNDALIGQSALIVRFEVLNRNRVATTITDYLVPAMTLARNTSKTFECTCRITTTDAMSLKATFRTDIFEKISLTNNNVKEITLPLPKIDITEARYDKDRKQLTVVVKNTGKRDAVIPAGSVQVSKKVTYSSGESKTFYSLVTPTTLTPGQDIAFFYDHLSNPAEKYLEISLKTTAAFLEESSNHSTIKIALPLPDLTFIDAQPTADGRIKAIVQNAGSATAKLSSTFMCVTVNFYYTDRSGDTKLFDSACITGDLPVSGQKEVISPKTFPTGAVSGGVEVNTTGLILAETESGARNNTRPVTFKLPELGVTLTYDELSGKAIAEVKNNGTGPANFVSLFGPGFIKTEFNWFEGGVKSGGVGFNLEGKLDPGASRTFTTPQLPDTATSVEVQIDSLNYIYESDDDNDPNNKATLEITHYPDLIISSVEQDKHTIIVHVKNIGKAAVNGPLKLQKRWSDDPNNPEYSDLGNVTIAIDGESTFRFSIRPALSSTVLNLFVSTPAEKQIANNFSDITIPGDELPVKLDSDLIGSEIVAALNDASSGATLDPKKAAGILPDSPFYIFKELGRGVEDVITFDNEKKVDLRKKFANEQSLEVNVLIDENKPKEAVNASKKKSKTDESVDKALEDIRKNKPTLADELAVDILKDRIKQESVLDKLKPKLDVEGSLEVSEIEDQTLDATGALAGTIKDPEKLKAAFDAAFSGKGSPYKPLKDLVAINKISTHIANGNARNILLGAKEKQQNHLKNNLQSLKPEQLKVFKDYVDKTTGDKVNTLKALDDTKVVIADKNVRAAISSAKQSTASKLVKDIKTAKGKKLKAGAEILSDLEGGTITDLRVLSDLKNVDKDIASDIEAVNKKSINNFKKHVSSLKPNEKEKYLRDITKDHVDLTQQAVVNEFKRVLPNDPIGNDLDATLKSEVKVKVGKVKNNKAEYDEFLDSVTSDTADDKESINAFTSGFDASFFKDIMRQQLAYMKEYYAGSDPETKKWLDEFYFNNAEIKAFYTDFDGTFEKMFSEYNEADYSSENSEEEQYEVQEEFEEVEEESYEDDTNTTSGCSMTYDPVCGKDGLNYTNECEAKDNATEVDYKGECREESSISEDNYSSEPVEENYSEESVESGSGEDSGDVEGITTKRAPDGLFFKVWHWLF